MKWILKKFEIETKADFYKVFWQFFKFGMVGVSNTVVSMAIYYLFLWIDEDLYLVGSIVGTVVSILNAFIFNELFVFSGNNRDIKSLAARLGKTYISYGGTSILSNVLLWIEVAFLSISKVYAPVINLFITIPLNFVINKFWTFKKSRNQKSEDEEGTQQD